MTELQIQDSRRASVGILRLPGVALFVCLLPFAYYPRLIDGDTQPWTLLATLLLFALNRQARSISRTDLLVAALGAGCLVAYLPRSGIGEDFLRFAYEVGSFTLLWIVVTALPTQTIIRGIKAVLITWFVVAVWQTASVELGWGTDFAGRYVPGRSGVPSLTPEPSMLGMLSVLALLYLTNTNGRTSPVYYAVALANVLLSGALLGILAFGFVLLFLGVRTRLALIVILAPVAVYLFVAADLSFLARIKDMLQYGLEPSALLRDYSINLRVGHVVHTLWASLPQALMWQTTSSFAQSYNDWAASSGQFFPTGSDFILTGAGDVVYRGGLFGFALITLALVTAFRHGGRRPLAKVLFIAFLLLSQIGISNVFLVLFLRQKAS